MIRHNLLGSTSRSAANSRYSNTADSSSTPRSKPTQDPRSYLWWQPHSETPLQEQMERQTSPIALLTPLGLSTTRVTDTDHKHEALLSVLACGGLFQDRLWRTFGGGVTRAVANFSPALRTRGPIRHRKCARVERLTVSSIATGQVHICGIVSSGA